MKEKGSRIASEIITDWNYERYLRSLYKTKKRFEEEDKKKNEPVSSTKPYETRKLTTGLDELMK